MAKQNLQFIADTINTMLSNKVNDTSTINKIIGSANQYAQVRKFPPIKKIGIIINLNNIFLL